MASDVAGPQLVTGWGRASSSAARIKKVESQQDLERLVVSASKSETPMLARGLGRSYGDAAQCADGILLDCTALDRIIDADFDHGSLHVEAGISLDAVLRYVVPMGWFVPVTPGTRHVTIGGAIAADVHGKNHHRDGAIGSHVERLALMTPTGRVDVSSNRQRDVYWATVGAMGLTGVIGNAEIRMHPIETAFMLVDIERATDLEQCMAMLAASDDDYRYSVAWVDCEAHGRQFGRAVLSRGDHARLADLPPGRRTRALEYRVPSPLNVPVASPFNLIVRAAVRAGNELWYRKSPVRRTGELESFASFFYPLDAIANWNRLYGPRGFTQYQFVVPFGAEATVQQVLEHLQAAGVGPSLGVLKRLGEADPAPLSFPMPGWTLALDIPLGSAAVGPALDEIDNLVATVGGRVYLAKDGRLRPELLRVMYPRLDRVARDARAD